MFVFSRFGLWRSLITSVIETSKDVPKRFFHFDSLCV
ncbi:MAG TPA: hypothetical protein DEB17_02305 [Chlorobaculum sp.]|uniref:Uncharacterized protein n=1 Tax=Chlorobaculum tepidum (strain ATCC 49652 / DSM 12025 / NBRC 103806 / TLS) TaxID=194439 RepID=Q8KEP1_CHLTE|nr:hypothetical protein CT0645 [Chlorobaculum tepidum TLS]HBU22829.1 hypothetical protein [Chlorobaculum sp.]